MARRTLHLFVLVTIVLIVGQPAAWGQQPSAPPTFPALQPPPPKELTPIPLPPLQPSFSSPYIGPPTFNFTFDAKAPLKELLPTPPRAKLARPMLLNDDLTKVPEIAFGEPLSRELNRNQAIEKIAHQVAKVNHLNKPKRDGFMVALLAERGDLRGLAFRMGDECRTPAEQAKLLSEVSELIQTDVRLLRDNTQPEQAYVDVFWSRIQFRFNAVGSSEAKTRVARCGQEALDRAVVAALMQIIAPESERCRVGLAKFLGTINHLDAIQALAKLAIFSAEEPVRTAAIDGLKLRRERDYTPILMEGFRYPLPAVSRRAAEALIKLDRKDLLPSLIAVLEQPDPRAPAKQEVDGKEVAVLREVVRVNHHTNCLMCHAPGNTGNVPDGVLKVAMPLPTDNLLRPSDAYYSTPPASPDIVVRIDTTYLRQDFSQMMAVENANPWPTQQRFDFLVRTRVLTEEEQADCEQQLAKQASGTLPGAHRAALLALRELTGRDTEPTAVAWRRLLKLPK